MIKRIYPLPPSLTNQIAAGEVIERPASVVKELLENALDAKAHQINITIEAGGVRLIEISDDGNGIHPEDLLLAVMSHATSKIRLLDDLFSIRSLGFRGEALASISAVSRFSMVSKIADCGEGYELIFDELKQTTSVSPKARTQGTTISVRDLFFNTPVRRRFLASEKTEWTQIENVVKRIALSRFDVGFQLKYKTVLNLPAVHSDAGIEGRVKKIFGSAFLAQSEKIDIERDGMRLWGWIGLPSLMRSQNDLQYVYLNGRMIRDKLIGHAIRTAYEGHLYPGRQPIFLLYLDMPPEQVDVNVHPTKHEVRFRESRQVHDFIGSHLARVLNQRTIQAMSTPVVTPTYHEKTPEKDVNHIQEPQAVYTPHKTTQEVISSPFLSIQWLELPYCLIKSPTAYFLCNYVGLYQGLCRERYCREVSSNNVTIRPLLVPVRLTLSLDKIISEITQWEALGLSLNALDEQTLLIRAFPATLPYLNFNQWQDNLISCRERKDDSEAALMNSLVKANYPSWPIASHDLQASLSDFQSYLSEDNMPVGLKQYYKEMKSSDWEKILK